MKQVCLVWEQGGDYDSRYDNVILVFETLEEGERAVALIEDEVKRLYQLPSVDARFNAAWTQNYDRVVGDRDSVLEACRSQYEADVRAICRVYPCEIEVQGSTGIRKVLRVPDQRRDDPTFHAVMKPISSLPA